MEQLADDLGRPATARPADRLKAERQGCGCVGWALADKERRSRVQASRNERPVVAAVDRKLVAGVDAPQAYAYHLSSVIVHWKRPRSPLRAVGDIESRQRLSIDAQLPSEFRNGLRRRRSAPSLEGGFEVHVPGRDGGGLWPRPDVSCRLPVPVELVEVADTVALVYLAYGALRDAHADCCGPVRCDATPVRPAAYRAGRCARHAPPLHGRPRHGRQRHGRQRRAGSFSPRERQLLPPRIRARRRPSPT